MKGNQIIQLTINQRHGHLWERNTKIWSENQLKYTHFSRIALAMKRWGQGCYSYPPGQMLF